MRTETEVEMSMEMRMGVLEKTGVLGWGNLAEVWSAGFRESWWERGPVGV